MDLKNLQELLNKCYTKDLCYPKVSQNWSENNKCYGMCVITALVLNDYFKGNLGKIYVENISHYFNIINDKIVDFTSSQFEQEVDYSNYELVDRDIILQNEDTKLRYHILKSRLEKLLKQENINNTEDIIMNLELI